MQVHLFVDGCCSYHKGTGGYGAVAIGDMTYQYSEMIAGCKDQHHAELIALCESIQDLANRLKYKKRLYEVHLTVHSDNNMVIDIFKGAKLVPNYIRDKYPHITRLIESFGSFKIRETHGTGSIYMCMADKLGRLEMSSMYLLLQGHKYGPPTD